jgi:hypothetical protein
VGCHAVTTCFYVKTGSIFTLPVETAGFGNEHLYRPFLANDPPGKRIVFVSSWQQAWYISGNPVQILQAGQTLPEEAGCSGPYPGEGWFIRNLNLVKMRDSKAPRLLWLLSFLEVPAQPFDNF